MLTFFGLTPEYRLHIFRTLHEIVFHGNGGYDFMTVYNFPIWLRKFVYKSMEEHYDKVNKSKDSDLTNQSPTKKSAAEVARPGISPRTVYSTKAPKK